jgi:hypothetical protein
LKGSRAALAVVAIAILGFLIYYAKFGPQAEIKPEPGTQGAGSMIQVPVAQGGGQDLKFGMTSVKAEPGIDPAVTAVNAFLGSLPFVQPEARLLAITYERENAILQFSSNFRTTYGTDDEATLVKGVIKAVSMNSKVKSITFTEGGRDLDTLGNIDLVGPQSVADWLK